MPRVKSFRAVRYNPSVIKDISAVVSPPYDIISPGLQEELYERDERNFVRIDLNRIEPSDSPADNRYTRSKDIFESWMRGKILARDAKESVYIYSLKYKKIAKAAEQIGFIALMGLEGGTKVLPHENTLAAPKEDRLKLTRAVGANLSPIFVLYEDASHALTRLLKKASKGKPLVDIVADGVRHRLWAIDDPRISKRIEDAMSARDIFIADGHHRYEVSRAYYNEARTESSKYIMAYFVELDEKMLTILPAHRVIKDAGGLDKDEILARLKKFFQIEKPAALKTLLAKMDASGRNHSFGAYLGGGAYYLLRLKNEKSSDAAINDKPREWRKLDVSILHRFMIQHLLGIRDDDENVEFLKNSEEAAKAVDSGKFKLAFFLNPTKAEEVKKIARIGERMPRKSTYFYPKPLSGLVINKF